MTVKRKRGRPPKPKPQIPSSKTRTMTAAKNLTTQPQQHPRSLNNEIVSRQMITEIRKIFIITTKSPTINTSSDSYTKDVRKTPRF